jgi:hypothetical protein
VAESQSRIFSKCLGLILGPIAHFCLSRAIKFQDFSEVAKRAFLGEAKKEMERLNLDPTAVRLSVMTGLQRRDVARLQSSPAEKDEEANAIGRIIGLWSENRRYQNANGRPRALNIEGKESEFAQLVRSVSKDLNSYAILFELERLGNIARKGNTVHLKRPAYEPRGNLSQSYSILAADTRDLISAVEENIASPSSPINLHARTEYDNVDPKAAPKIRLWFLKRGAKLHAEARKFISKFDKDINPNCSDGGIKVVLGSFSRVEDKSTNPKQPKGPENRNNIRPKNSREKE